MKFNFKFVPFNIHLINSCETLKFNLTNFQLLDLIENDCGSLQVHNKDISLSALSPEEEKVFILKMDNRKKNLGGKGKFVGGKSIERA